MKKVNNTTYVHDSELSGVGGVSHLKQVVDTEDQYKDVLKDAVVTRVANKGDSYITETIAYNILDIEADYDYPVYKYLFEGKEYFSNFKFANGECVNPQTIN